MLAKATSIVNMKLTFKRLEIIVECDQIPVQSQSIPTH